MKNPDKMSERELRLVAKAVVRCLNKIEERRLYTASHTLDWVENALKMAMAIEPQGEDRFSMIRQDRNKAIDKLREIAEVDFRGNRSPESQMAYEFLEEIGEIDPTPWCHVCGAETEDRCQCGPLAETR